MSENELFVKTSHLTSLYFATRAFTGEQKNSQGVIKTTKGVYRILPIVNERFLVIFCSEKSIYSDLQSDQTRELAESFLYGYRLLFGENVEENGDTEVDIGEDIIRLLKTFIRHFVPSFKVTCTKHSLKVAETFKNITKSVQKWKPVMQFLKFENNQIIQRCDHNGITDKGTFNKIP